MIDMLHWVGAVPIADIEKALPAFVIAFVVAGIHLVLLCRAYRNMYD